jgi:hypothetical protein
MHGVSLRRCPVLVSGGFASTTHRAVTVVRRQAPREWRLSSTANAKWRLCQEFILRRRLRDRKVLPDRKDLLGHRGQRLGQFIHFGASHSLLSLLTAVYVIGKTNDSKDFTGDSTLSITLPAASRLNSNSLTRSSLPSVMTIWSGIFSVPLSTHTDISRAARLKIAIKSCSVGFLTAGRPLLRSVSAPA